MSSSSWRHSGHRSAGDKKSSSKPSSSGQKSAYKTWNNSADSRSNVSSKAVPPPKQEQSVEEQINRANVISDMDTSEFIPQSFVSKRVSDEEKPKTFGSLDNAGKGQLTGVLAGPVENLISPNIVPKSENERNTLQAEILSALRADLFEKRTIS